MNIFYLNEDPKLAAWDYELSHLSKIRVEISQMVSAAFFHNGYDAPDKVSKAQYNHPVTRWVRESEDNFLWTMEHWKELISLFRIQYGDTGLKTEAKLQWVLENQSKLVWSNFKMTPVKLAFVKEHSYLKEEFGTKTVSLLGFTEYIAPLDIAVKAYQKYYIVKEYKNQVKRWRYDTPPEWYSLSY